MTKKDYELIAIALHQSYICLDDDNDITKEDIEHIARHLSLHFAYENPKFSIHKFMKACGL